MINIYKTPACLCAADIGNRIFMYFVATVIFDKPPAPGLA